VKARRRAILIGERVVASLVNRFLLRDLLDCHHNSRIRQLGTAPVVGTGYAIAAVLRPVSRMAALSEALSSIPDLLSGKDSSRYQID
jgi:hypothetical protein